MRRWYSKDNAQDELALAAMKSKCWKRDFVEERNPTWAIVVDSDEWLDIWESDLEAEDARGSMILTTEGFTGVGTSHRLDLTDIDLHTIRFGMAATSATRLQLAIQERLF